jgi:outer membrane protein OmpA-like peptidoglycan-associated protein
MRNIFLGIIFLIQSIIRPNGFAQNQNNDIDNPLKINMQHSIGPLNLLPNQLPLEKVPFFQQSLFAITEQNSKIITGFEDTSAIKSICLKWGKSAATKSKKKNYFIIVDPDSAKIAKFILELKRKQEKIYPDLPENLFLYQKFLEADSFALPAKIGGHFYWSVFEGGKDGKLKCIKQKSHQISSIIIPGANLEIQQFAFEYSPWITQDDYHGELKVDIKNTGNQSAQQVWVIITDSVLTPFDLPGLANPKELSLSRILARKQIKHINADETLSLTFPWRTPFLGRHKIRIQVLEQNEHFEYSRSSEIFSTIPKGYIATDENPVALKISQVSFEIPIITEISFDANSCVVRPEYLHKISFEPPLLVLAKRLKQAPEASIILQGFSDANSDTWNPDLADDRSRAISDSLINLGVMKEQISIQRGHILPRINLVTSPDESRWIFEERRHVRILTKSPDLNSLLNPIQCVDHDVVPQPVGFEVQIKTRIPFTKALINIKNEDIKDRIDFSNQTKSQKIYFWTPVKSLADSGWLDKQVQYYLSLTDSLGRTFKTHNQNVRLGKSIYYREHRIALPIKYAQSNLNFELYWSRIFDQITNLFPDPEKRLCFTGHACAIGSEVSNRLLSQKRAERFHIGLMEYIRKTHPEYYGVIKERMIPARGFGESKPLIISQLNGAQILVGDNNQALGRRLNRRIEVIFIQEGAVNDL